MHYLKHKRLFQKRQTFCRETGTRSALKTKILFENSTVVTLNCTIPLIPSFSLIVTRSMFPGTFTLGSAPGGGVTPMTLTSVIFNNKDSSASGISSYKVDLINPNQKLISITIQRYPIYQCQKLFRWVFIKKVFVSRRGVFFYLFDDNVDSYSGDVFL